MKQARQKITALFMAVIMLLSSVSPAFAHDGAAGNAGSENIESGAEISFAPTEGSVSVLDTQEPQVIYLRQTGAPEPTSGENWFHEPFQGVIHVLNGANLVFRMHSGYDFTMLRIQVAAGATATVELHDVEMRRTGNHGLAGGFAPILLGLGTHLNLYIRGNNSIYAGGYGPVAAIQSTGATLRIANAPGTEFDILQPSLYAVGSTDSAAIGGSAGLTEGQNSGDIIIDGGIITARAGGANVSDGTLPLDGSNGAAGIGGGGPIFQNGRGGNADTITINGGRVIATGTGNGAGIGGAGARHGDGGGGHVVGGIFINGGHVTATGSGNGACIGGGGGGVGADAIGLPGNVARIFIAPGTHVCSLRSLPPNNARCAFGCDAAHFMPMVGPGSTGSPFEAHLPTPPFGNVFFEHHLVPDDGYAWVTFDLDGGSFGQVPNPARDVVPHPQKVPINGFFSLIDRAELDPISTGNFAYPLLYPIGDEIPPQRLRRVVGTREYAFGGWSPSVTTPITTNTTVRPIWRLANTHSVEFDYIGNSVEFLRDIQVNDSEASMDGPLWLGEGGTPVQSVPYADGGNVFGATPPIVFNPGWRINDWVAFCPTDLGTPLPDVHYSNITQDVVFRASWGLDSWTVTFNPGEYGRWAAGQAGFIRQAIPHRTHVPQIPVLLPWYAVTMEDFLGWYCSVTDHTYAPGEQLPRITENVVFTAVWYGRAFNATFIFGEHPYYGIYEGAPGATQITRYNIPRGGVALAPELRMEHDGWTFAGWAAYPEDANPFHMTQNATFTALWRVPYVVMFDLNGGNIDGRATPHYVQNRRPGGLAMFPLNPVRRGYCFEGWNLPQNITGSQNVLHGADCRYYICHENCEVPCDQYRLVNPCDEDCPGLYGRWFFRLPWSAHDIPSYTIILRAGWRAHYNHVTFDSGIGNFVPEYVILARGQRIRDGRGAILPQVQDHPDYLFDGWYNEYGISYDNIFIANGNTCEEHWCVEGHVEFNARWRRLHTVTFNPNGGGLISGELTHRVANGDNVLVMPVVTRDGWAFTHWSGDYRNVTSNRTITAQWTQDIQTVDFSAIGNGRLTAEIGGRPFNSGETAGETATVVFTATPDYGYSVYSWEITGGSFTNATGTTRSVVVGNEPITVTVTFARLQHAVTFSVVDGIGGTIAANVGESPLSSGNSVDHGTTVSFRATPNPGFRLAGWSSEGTIVSGTGELVSAVVNQNAVVHVRFEPIPRNISWAMAGNIVPDTVEIAVTANGRTLPNVGGIAFIGETVIFTVRHSDGVEMGEWVPSLNLVQDNTLIRYIVVGEQDIHVTINFDPIAFGVTVECATGNANAIPYADVYYLTEVVINAGVVPAEWQPERWHFARWTAAPDISIANYTTTRASFLMPESNVTVTANWELGIEVIGGTATYSGNPITQTAPGTRIDLTPGEAPANQEFYRWAVETAVPGVDVVFSNEYIVMPASPVTLTPQFRNVASLVTFGFAAGSPVGTITAMSGGQTLASGVHPTNPVRIGDTIDFTITPPTDSIISGWTVNGGTYVGELGTGTRNLVVTVTAAAVNVTIYVTPPERVVNFSVVGGSSIPNPLTATVNGEPITSGDGVEQGSTVVFVADPGVSYEVSWAVTAGGNPWPHSVIPNNSISVDVGHLGPINVVATFTRRVVVFGVYGEYADSHLTATVNGEPIVSGSEVNLGDIVVFAAALPIGGNHQISRWTVNGVTQTGTGTTFNHVIAGSYDVRVAFERIPRMVTFEVVGDHGDDSFLTAMVDGEAIVSLANVGQGLEVTFTADSDNTNYQVRRWTVNGEPVYDTSTTLIRVLGTEGLDVTVEFERIPRVVTFGTDSHTITPSAITAVVIDGGTRTPIESGDYVGQGLRVEFTAIPATGHSVVRWDINGGTLGGNATGLTRYVYVGVEDLDVTVIFDLVEYTVTFMSEGEVFHYESVSRYDTVSEPDTTDLEHSYLNSFIGWFTAEIDGEQFDFGNTQITEDITLYARWEGRWTVTFRLNEGVYDGSSNDFVHANVLHGTSVTPPDATRDGFREVVWLRYGDTPHLGFNNVTRDMEFVAEWIDDYNAVVRFFLYAGGRLLREVPAPINSALSAIEDPVRPGYDFEGWNPAPIDNQFQVTTDMAIVGTWSIVQSTITWVANGGTPAPEAITVTHGSIIAEPTAMTRPGFVFGGWYDEDNRSVSFPFSGVTTSMSLWAMWTLDEHTITWHAEGGTFAVSPGMDYVETFVLHEDEVTSAPEITRHGFTLVGWLDYEGEAVSFPIRVTTSMALRANWNVAEYTVTWHTNGGEWVNAPPHTTVQHGGTITTAAIALEGHDFGGWYRDTGFNVRAEFPIENVEQDIELWARWHPHEYTITWNLYNATFVTTSALHGHLVTPPVVAREGYTFEGWYTDAERTILADLSSATGNAEFFARWEPIPVSVRIEWVAGGGTPIPTQTEVYVGSNINEPAQMTRYGGYVFAGWYTSMMFAPGTRVTFPLQVTEPNDVWLFARWEEPGTLVVTWHTNGGTPVPTQIVVPAGGAIGIPAEMTRDGYNFVGWFFDELLTMPANLPIMDVTTNTALWASWTAAHFTITVECEGDVATASHETATAGTTIILTAGQRTGYTFLNWTSTPIVEFTSQNEFTMPRGHVIVTANWERDALEEFTVTFDLGAVDVIFYGDLAQTVLYGHDATPPTIVSRPGYEFDGWDGNYRNITGDTTINATWVQVFTVTFHLGGGTFVHGGETVTGQAIQLVRHGGNATAPTNPMREGFTFQGWQPTVSYREVTANINIHALWEPTTPTPGALRVIFDLVGGTHDGEQDLIQMVESGGNATPPTGLSRDGYFFLGWSPSGGYRNVTAERTITARWTVRATLGDIDGDGRVTSADASAFARFLVSYSEAEIAQMVANGEKDMEVWDIDGDGAITPADLTLLVQWLVGHVPFGYVPNVI